MFVKDESTGPRRVGVMSDVHHAMRSFIWSWQSTRRHRPCNAYDDVAMSKGAVR